MTEHENQLNQLRGKVEKLINLQEVLLAETRQLRLEKVRLTETIASRDQTVIDCEEKIKMIKMAQMVTGSDQNTREIKLKINEYIREIDKCLALINR